MIGLTLLACGGMNETLSGTIGDGPGPDSNPAVGASVRLFDREFQLVDQDTTDADGSFEVDGPRGETVFAEVGGLGFVSAGFVGVMGAGRTEVPDGELFVWTNEAQEALVQRYSGCPAAGEGTGTIHGEIRLFGAIGSNGEEPLVASAFARLIDDEDAIVEACYVDGDGVWSEENTATGPLGEYALFGVEPGLHTLEVGFVLVGQRTTAELVVYVPEDGIAPQFPAYVDLEL